MDGWIEGRAGEERSPSSSSFSLFLMSAAAAESIRHISGQELRVPFILPPFLPFLPPSLSPSFPPSPCRPGNVLYKARGR